MKKIIVCILLVLTSAAAVMATESSTYPIIKGTQLFNNFTGAAGSIRYSNVVNVNRFPQKSVIIAGQHSSSIYSNYSGTVTLQCAPTATGPWQTCKDNGNNAVSATTDTHFNLTGLVQYIRATWTKTKHNISVWLFYNTL